MLGKALVSWEEVLAWMTPFPGFHDPEIQDKPDICTMRSVSTYTPEVGYLYHFTNDTLWPRDFSLPSLLRYPELMSLSQAT